MIEFIPAEKPHGHSPIATTSSDERERRSGARLRTLPPGRAARRDPAAYPGAKHQIVPATKPRAVSSPNKTPLDPTNRRSFLTEVVRFFLALLVVRPSLSAQAPDRLKDLNTEAQYYEPLKNVATCHTDPVG